MWTMATAQQYPASLTIDTPERIARWRPLVQWLLAVPHLIVLYALGALSSAVAFVAWFVILVTGRLPTGLAGLQAMYLRYHNRVVAYQGFLLESYPPFSFSLEGADPGTYERESVDFDPQLQDRSRLSTFFRWLLVIPHVVVLTVLAIVAFLAWIVGFFAVLITGRWPEGLQHFVVGYIRWTLRVEAYWLLLTDEYPPFRLD